MKIELNPYRFDELQLKILEEIMISIKEGLQIAGVVDKKNLYDSTAEIAFSIATIIDGSRIMELDGKPVVPFLAFAKEQSSDELVAAEGGSWMHEYVFGLVDEIFSPEIENQT
ncbi:hypothetical protein [Pseudanabaena mucicola]|uniref:Uncharacterized protein n=1 Tax=Pseudanabaena mucicola FACHB-723 TaxID=2692860 RepID=A0ABR7ZZV9_9CYAN|nr:hypothetical protein [Pseudanabaena mucicola]MBD2189442.1 hypothetical protein [Pseudanabaena mucicola FACHB-723]